MFLGINTVVLYCIERLTDVFSDVWTSCHSTKPMSEGSLLVSAILVTSTADVSPHSSIFRFSVRGLGLHAAGVVLCPQGVLLGGQEDQYGRHQQDQQLFPAIPVNRRQTTLHYSNNNMANSLYRFLLRDDRMLCLIPALTWQTSPSFSKHPYVNSHHSAV